MVVLQVLFFENEKVTMFVFIFIKELKSPFLSLSINLSLFCAAILQICPKVVVELKILKINNLTYEKVEESNFCS